MDDAPDRRTIINYPSRTMITVERPASLMIFGQVSGCILAIVMTIDRHTGEMTPVPLRLSDIENFPLPDAMPHTPN